MKRLLLTSAVLVGACGPQKPPAGEFHLTQEQVGSCTVTDVPEGALITCEDGTATLIPHAKASDGINGVDGLNGTNGRDGVDGQDGRDGTNGTNGTAGADGADGQDGTDGVAGRDGLNGRDGRDGKTNQDLVEWYHPITGVRFILTSQTSGSKIESEGYNCPSGSQSPDDVEDLLSAGLSTYFLIKTPSLAKVVVGYDDNTNEVLLMDKRDITRASSGGDYTSSYHRVCEVL